MAGVGSHLVFYDDLPANPQKSNGWKRSMDSRMFGRRKKLVPGLRPFVLEGRKKAEGEGGKPEQGLAARAPTRD